jgi:hypothetical protein
MRRRLSAALAAVATAAAVAVPAASAATRNHSFVVYAKATRAQFINHADDRQRGLIRNPFNPDLLPAPRNANVGKKGARAGDNALFSLELYSDRSLTRPVGTAMYSCRFNFAQEAICDAQFTLGHGSILAMGPAKLDGRPIVLAVTGGTGRYAGAHGQMTSTSSSTKKNTQIIRFELV